MSEFCLEPADSRERDPCGGVGSLSSRESFDFDRQSVPGGRLSEGALVRPVWKGEFSPIFDSLVFDRACRR